MVALTRMEFWTDGFLSTLEMLDFCQRELSKLQKRKSAVLEEGHVKSVLPRMFGSDEEKDRAFKVAEHLRRKLETIERRADGFREWSAIAAKGAALALHDFGRAHFQIAEMLAKNAKSVDSMIPAEAKKEATRLFHDEFEEVYATVRDGISHMQEKFGLGPTGVGKHSPKNKDQIMYGLALSGRRFSTTWKGKNHSIMLDLSTVEKMERVVQLWSAAFRYAALAADVPGSASRARSLKRLRTIWATERRSK